MEGGATCTLVHVSGSDRGMPEKRGGGLIIVRTCTYPQRAEQAMAWHSGVEWEGLRPFADDLCGFLGIV
jgi:hypothetical protein